MEAGAETLGNILLVILTLLLVIGFGRLILSAARAAANRGKWDFFLSYKSENANEVRRIAERLMAAGYRVWFAEYQILLRSYVDFEPLIREGIKNCSFGILFTTNDYFGSKHCRNEVEWLHQRFEKEPWRIIEVRLENFNDATRTLGLSTKSQPIACNLPSQISQECGEDEDLLTRLSSITGLNLCRGGKTPPPSGNSPRFHARCAPISFDPSGFVLKEWKTHPVDGTDIVSFEGESGPVRFGFNVYFHYSPQAKPGQPFTLSANPVDDRKLYTELRAYALWWMKQMRMRAVFLRERGLHLIWIDGRAQLALTHSFLWVRMRKYSVILNQLPRSIQLIFTFGVTGGFDDFCRLVLLMDRVIESIRIDNGSGYRDGSR